MNAQYHPLLTIEPFHDYFPEGKCPILSFIPTTATRSNMHSLGLRMINRENSVEIYYLAGGGFTTTPEEKELEFIVRPTDGLFLNYTDLEQSEATQHITTNSPDGSPQNGPDFLSGDVGTVKFRISPSEELPRKVAIRFSARRTIWRYYIIDQNTSSTNLRLRDLQTQEALTVSGPAPPTKQLPNGNVAVVLAMPTALPLRQRPTATAELLMEDFNTGAQTTITLPNADVNQIIPDVEDATLFYSDIYVYI